MNSTISFLLPLLLLLCLAPAHGASFPAPDLVDRVGSLLGPWDDAMVVLNGNLGLKWRVEGNEVTMLLASSIVEGWIGFGFGEPSSGSMLGADLVVASVDEQTGMVKALDTHVPFSSSSPFPEEDDQQDWIALGGEQSENGTVVVLQRKLDTGDQQDRAISLQDKYTRVLFAYGLGDNGPNYHGANRGIDKINFLGKQPTEEIPHDADDHFDMTVPHITLLQGTTDSYFHRAIDLGEGMPDIVGAEFLAETPNFVHHTIVYDCETPNNKEWTKYLENDELELPDAISTCVPMFGWALGGDTNLLVPPQAGLKNIRYILLEVHYNQPVTGFTSRGDQLNAGAGNIDASGFRIYTTSKPRRLKAGSMIIMTMKNNGMALPVNEPFAHYESTCSGECTKRNPKPLHIYNSFLHMHSHGRQIWASHYNPDNNFQGYIGKTEYWNFQFQNYVPVNVTVHPGDTIGLHCVFDTTKTKGEVFWGDKSEDEMCLVILQYYSEEESPTRVCGSMQLPEEIGIDHPVAVCHQDMLMEGTKWIDPTLRAPCDNSSGDFGTFPLQMEFDPPSIDVTSNASSLQCDERGTSPGGIVGTVVTIAVIFLVLVTAYTDLWRKLQRSSDSVVATPNHTSGERTENNGRAGTYSRSSSTKDSLIVDTIAPDVKMEACAAETNHAVLLQRAKDFVEQEQKHQPFEKETILGHFQAHVASNPHKLLYAWLNDKTDVVGKMTRKELWDQSRDLAFHLQTNCGVKPGDRVMIVYPFGIEFMVGIVALLRIGAIIVSVYPPNPTRLATEIPKFAHFVKDCGATVALTTTEFHRIVQASSIIHKSWPQGITWVKTDKKYPTPPTTYQDYTPDPDSVALIQYTSGSTNDPKGVMLTHSNLNHQVAFLLKCYHVYAGNTPTNLAIDEFVNVSWTPQFHDMALFGSFIVHLAGGGTSYAMSPLTFMRNPTLWVKAMQRYKASVTNGPNFAFALTCKRLREQKDKEPTVSFPPIPSMKFVVYGAEPSDIRLLDDIEEYMGIGRCSVASMFGLAEHVVAVSSGASQTLYDDMLWSVGNLDFTRALGGTEIRIVNPDTRMEAALGDTGEIWISSPCVGVGYWGRPELTADTFMAKQSGGNSSMDTYLRTGDLGFVRDNDLFIVSRLKDLIIIAGKNLAPTDLERAAEEGFPKLVRPGSSVAFQATDQSAVLLCEIRPEAINLMSMDLLSQQILSHVQDTISGAVVEEVVLLQKGGVEKTSSGKVKRQAMKKRWLSGNLKTVASSHGASKAGQLKSASSIEELFEIAGVEDFERTLVENGVDSMQLVQLVEVAREKFDLQMNYGHASTLPVRDLLASLSSHHHKAEVPLVKVSCDTQFSEELARKLLPGPLFRWLRQTAVLLVVFAVSVACFVPSGLYIRHNWDYKSDLWIHQYRLGPMVALAFPIWALAYSATCILFKWILVGRLRPGQSFAMWSSGFARWYTVTRLAAIWEFTVGPFVADTPLRNMFYNAMGAKIALSARLTTPISCWDLVEIGAEAKIKGAITAHMFHWTGVYFQQITIGSRCSVGSGAVVMVGSELSSGVRLSNRSVVPPGTRLGPDSSSWSGLPCTRDDSPEQPSSPSMLCGPCFTAIVRTVVPFFLFAAVVAAWWVANEIGPQVPESRFDLPGASEEWLYRLSVYYHSWHSVSFGGWASYVLVHEIAGLLMLLGCLLLKWSFLCPYLVDRMEPLILGLYFPFIPKTFLHTWWHRLFGMRIGRGSVIVSMGTVVSPSTAHRVEVGRESLIFSGRFLPRSAPSGVAKDVWQWLLSGGRLQNPWTSLVAPADIVVGNHCECAAGSFIEEGVVMQDHSGTGTATRVTKSLDQGVRVVGNPGDLLLASKTGPSSPTSFQQEQLPLVACVMIRNLLALLHFAYLFAGVITILEISNNLPFPSYWELEITLPLEVAVAYVLLVALLALEILLAKHILFGRTRSSSFSLRTYRGLIYHHLQVLDCPFIAVAYPLISGLYPLGLFYKALGTQIDDVSSVLLEGYPDPGDAEGTTLRPHSVVSEHSYCVCHRVDHGMLHHGTVLLNSGATLHPGAILMLGSLGRGSQLFPLSKALRETHTEDHQVWIGYPSVRADYALMSNCNQATSSKLDEESQSRPPEDIDV